MKKVISVFLAALMLMACVSVSGMALDGVCECGEGVHVEGVPCSCCVYCELPDKSKWSACYDEAEDKFCCEDCDGIYPCGCDCGCESCKAGNQYNDSDKPTIDKVVSEQDKENFVDGFQAVLKKVSDFFDMLFDAIFEFLRIDEVLGKGDNPEA